jgi:hypothetical protein
LAKGGGSRLLLEGAADDEGAMTGLAWSDRHWASSRLPRNYVSEFRLWHIAD